MGMAQHTSILKAIREQSIVSYALSEGLAAAAFEFNLRIWEVKQIVSRAIQDHQDVMKSHQDSIAQLRNILDSRECYKCGQYGHIARNCNDASYCCKCGKEGHIARNCSCDDSQAWCRLCNKKGHMVGDCSADGCSKCSGVGHLGRDCPRDSFFDIGRRLCYNCGMDGYMAVCSRCGERGHLGKDCW